MPAPTEFTLEILERSSEASTGLNEFIQFYARNLYEELSCAGVCIDPERFAEDIRCVEKTIAARSLIHLARADGQLVGSVRCTPSDGRYRDLPIENEYGPELSNCLLRIKRTGRTMEFARFAVEKKFRSSAALIMQLLKSATDTALANDIHFIILDTTASKMELYRKLGFDVMSVGGKPEHARMNLWGHQFTMMLLNFSKQIMRDPHIRYDHGLNRAVDDELVSRWLASAYANYASNPCKPWELEMPSLTGSAESEAGRAERE